MNKKEILKIAFYTLLPIILGSIVGFAVKDDYEYIESLNKVINIPTIVFPIVWSILYILMGIWSYLYDHEYPEDNMTLSIYWISLFVNLLFSPLLFIFEQNVLATIDVVVLIVMVGYLFWKTLKNNNKFAYLLLPYLLWLFTALTLMIDILIHN